MIITERQFRPGLLKSFLEKNGSEAEVIYLYEGFGSIIKNKKQQIDRKYPTGKSLLTTLKRYHRLIKTPIDVFKADLKQRHNNHPVRIRLFTDFLNQYCFKDITPKQDYAVLTSGIDADIVFVGSDWVWRGWPQSGLIESLTAFCKVLFGFFPKKENQRLIAYAASTGENPDKVMPGFWADVLDNFDKVSLREKESITYLNELCGIKRDLLHAVDPTLLLTPKFYEDFLLNLKDKINTINEKYVVVYILSCKNEEVIKNYIKSAEEFFKLPIYAINKERDFKCENVITLGDKCGPLEFLAHISNAEYVITNSFHGMVFCTMFNKPFTAFSRAVNDVRQINLVRGLGLEDRLLPFEVQNAQEDLFAKPIDYAKVEERRQQWIGPSIEFLQQCLQDS